MKTYIASFRGMSANSDVRIPVMAINMDNAWIAARLINTSMILDEVYPTDDDWS